MGVAERFNKLLQNLMLTGDQVTDGATKRESVCKVLNEKYFNSNSGIANSQYVGSWLKHTRVRPPRDVDVLFKLPYDVYTRFQQRQGNKQSQLLQEIKTALVARFPQTDIRGDGPVILVPFVSYAIELLPGFRLQSGRYWIPITSNGGYYKEMDPDAEETAVKNSNDNTSGNTRDLIRMAKRWQYECSVPVKSFWLELVAINFLAQWPYKGKSAVYYDWMARDFLSYLVGMANSSVYAPGTYESMNMGSAWKSRAESARDRAIKACEYESNGFPALALAEWQKIFGNSIHD